MMIDRSAIRARIGRLLERVSGPPRMLQGDAARAGGLGDCGKTILMTNMVLSGRSGTEIFTEQLADKLRGRGRRVILYSPCVGPLGEAMRRRGHLVYDRIQDVTCKPDIIHGHHGSITVAALAAFPTTPAIFVSHSVEAEFDRPPLHPNILAYFAVSDLIPHRWASTGLPHKKFRRLGNAVDTTRFVSRPPLPPRPRTGLLVAKSGSAYDAVRRACEDVSIALTACGPGVASVSSDLPSLFKAADVVFASGRSALEAAATGCAVVLMEGNAFFGLIKRTNLSEVLRGNLGVAVLQQALTDESLRHAIECYDPADAASVAEFVRDSCSLDRQADLLEQTYDEIAGRKAGADPDAARSFVAGYIEDYVPRYGEGSWRRLTRYVANHLLTAHGSDLVTWHLSERLNAEQRILSVFDQQKETASAEDIAFAFRLLLGRNPGPDEWAWHVRNMSGRPLEEVVGFYMNSEEYLKRGLSERSRVPAEVPADGRQA